MSDATKHSESDSHTEGPNRPVEYRSASFSLRGVIAVTVLLGIVVGLVLPAIAQIREAARRAQCQNNLKQLALAFHNYESAFKRLPVGIQVVTGRNDTANSKAGNWSWSVFVQPYIEASTAYDHMNPNRENCLSDRIVVSAFGTQLANPSGYVRPIVKGAPDPWYNTMESVLNDMIGHIPGYHCPSDLSYRSNESHRTGVQNSNGATVKWPLESDQYLELATINYVAANSSRECYALMAGTANEETIAMAPDGLFHSVRATKLDEIVDGQSNTILLSERISGSLTPGTDRSRFGKTIPAGGATMFGCRGIGNSSIDGSATNDPADAYGASDVLFSAWGGINLDDPDKPWRKFQGVSSRHSGGVNIARADGSVEFFANVDVPDSLDEYGADLGSQPNAWRQLICKDDVVGIRIPD